MNKGFKGLLAASLVLQALAAPLVGPSSRAVSARESSASSQLSSAPTTQPEDETSSSALQVSQRTHFLMQAERQRDKLETVALVGQSGDERRTSQYEGAFFYNEEGAVQQAYLGYGMSDNARLEFYYPDDARHGVYVLDTASGKWTTLSSREDYAPKPDYRRILDWVLAHSKDFEWEDAGDYYRLQVLSRTFDLMDFTEEAMGIRLVPEETPVEDIYNYMEVRFDKTTYDMTQLTYRCLDPSGEVFGNFQFSHHNQLTSADFQLPADIPVDIETSSGAPEYDSSAEGHESGESRDGRPPRESRESRESRQPRERQESSESREGREARGRRTSRESQLSTEDGTLEAPEPVRSPRVARMDNTLYWLISLKWRQSDLIQRGLGAVTRHFYRLVQPPRVYR